MNALAARRSGVQTLGNPRVYMRSDCSICRSEGFTAHRRLGVRLGTRHVVAALQVVDARTQWLEPGQIGLCETAWRALRAAPSDQVIVTHADEPASMAYLRARLFGHPLSDDAWRGIVDDIVERRLSDIEMAAFVAGGSARPMDVDEITGLTRAMVDAGQTLQWDDRRVLDKHCIGGLPGNRTTPIVVSICAAAGLCIPKTSSRAITSPAGTADVVETLMPVDLDLDAIRTVVRREHGCLAWGGSVGLSPADDQIIRIERALNIDSQGQMVASILSKKVAAGAHSVLIDIPVGPTAKCRTAAAAHALSETLVDVGARLGLEVRCHLSDGRQPVGRGIGPANEARDVLAVLRNQDAARDLRERALDLASILLEMGGVARADNARELAVEILDSGAAMGKLLCIADAQGGLRPPPEARLSAPVGAPEDGRITAVDNRRLASLAKLAGAPDAPAAGLILHVRLDDHVTRGEALATVTAQSQGELDYALQYAADNPDIWSLHP